MGDEKKTRGEDRAKTTIFKYRKKIYFRPSKRGYFELFGVKNSDIENESCNLNPDSSHENPPDELVISNGYMGRGQVSFWLYLFFIVSIVSSLTKTTS